MNFAIRWARSLALSVVLAFGFAAMAAQPAAAAFYVDNTLGDVPPEQKASTANPQPVQLLFQFTTKGKANPKGAAFLKEKVVEAINSSGLFSEVSDGTVVGGAVLSITIDNLPEEGAAGKGVGVGLTLGLAGTKVTDFYVCTVEYLPPSGGAKITKVAKHAIHATIGLKSAPPEGTKAKNMQEAVFVMTRQIISHAVNALGQDAGFSGVIATPVATEAVPPAAPADPAEVPAETTPPPTLEPAPAEVVAS